MMVMGAKLDSGPTMHLFVGSIFASDRWIFSKLRARRTSSDCEYRIPNKLIGILYYKNLKRYKKN